jgi:hypothetical protein
MLFWEIIAYTNHRIAQICGQNAEFCNEETRGTCGNHCDFRGWAQGYVTLCYTQAGVATGCGLDVRGAWVRRLEEGRDFFSSVALSSVCRSFIPRR